MHFKCAFFRSRPSFCIVLSLSTSTIRFNSSITPLVSSIHLIECRDDVVAIRRMLTLLIALIFPQWDMVTVILCVFLLSYMYGEGKSNYFKGSILILSYFVVVVGFYFSSFNDFERMGVNPADT